MRARREALRPDEAGRRRRTPGLRREEVAARAGIGVTWCAWIEQGREVRPSADTLSRLAKALQLTVAERAYLFELAGHHDPDNPFSALDDDAPASVTAFVQAVPHPAYGLDPAWNICTWNEAARALFVSLEETATDRNLLRYVFTAPQARTLLPDWEHRARRILAEFRADFGRNPTDPRTQAVVEWLSARSALFREAWNTQSVSSREGGLRIFTHPLQGRLEFEQHTLHPADRPDFKLVMLEPCLDSI
ncbi:helix-turn-helix transcriptional regulator [Croceicoccus estronivorus]|uniref:helix-turn-helix transcriptional regulator n=1 Tax=Croceicoccus estronivorus TaxID=1172626 RepID=UPI001F19584D|nr:helix-turn-helix transcriptional regulator [Croceicoccus estronivorus]